jgi:hypothetical protein
MALPTGPIEPFVITKQNGPFMVLAHTFRGPDAARYAQALVIELRNKFQLPAYIFFAKIQPGRSNIRGIPPTAPVPVQEGEQMMPPEKYRNYDEAAVLVGDCKTVEDARELLKTVKKLRPESLDKLPSIYAWRMGTGLKRAILTTNPLVAAQYLYPGRGVPLKPGQVIDPSVVTAAFETAHKPDPLLKRMNRGPHTVYSCPGPFVLQVAEFSGRSTTNIQAAGMLNERELAKSPLAAAADEAEKLAEALSKARSLNKGLRPYVLHDRTSSKVFLGPFRNGNDPALIALLSKSTAEGLRPFDLVANEVVRQDEKHPTKQLTTTFIFPAGQLTLVPKD